MKRIIAAVLIVLSLACILSAAVNVVKGDTGLWSPTTLGSYLFHFVTMLAALALIAGKPKPAAASEEDS